MKRTIGIFLVIIFIGIVFANGFLLLSNKIPLRSSIVLSTKQDTEPPKIMNVNQNISIPEYFDAVNISVQLTDNVSISHVFIEYNYSIVIEEHEMIIGSGTLANGTWWYVIPPVEFNTTVKYQIKVNDTANNWNVSQIENYTVQDFQAPYFENFGRNISNVMYYYAVQVNVTINNPTNASTIDSVGLEFQNSSGGFNITASNSSSTWSAVIPTQDYGEVIQYQFWANDSAGNENQTGYQSYTVSDDLSPEILNVDQIPPVGDVMYYDTVELRLLVDDDPTSNQSAGVDIALLRYQNVTLGPWYNVMMVYQPSLSRYNASIPAHPYSTDITYQILVNDTAGNQNQTGSFSYVVSDDLGPEISSVVRNVSNPQYFDAVRINATVIEPLVASGINEVYLNFNINAGGWNSMNITGNKDNDIYWGDLDDWDYGTVMNYSILAEDNENNVRMHSINYSYIVEDRISPDIGPVQIMNFGGVVVYDYPATIQHIPFDLEPSSASRIKEIWLNYSFDLNNWLALDIFNATAGYQVQIPPQQFNTTVYYKINISDNAGNQNESQIMNYTVIDNIAPVITGLITTDIPLNLIYDTSIVNVSVGGVAPSGVNASGIKDVLLRYTNNTLSGWVVSSINGSLWGTIPKQLPLTNVTFQIIVEDYGGNQEVSDNFSYIVQTFRPYIMPEPESPDNDGVILLMWTIPDSTLDVASYRIYRATNALGPFTIIRTTLSRNENYYRDLGLEDGPYWYYVRSVMSNGSIWEDPDYISQNVSILVNDTIRPGRPNNVYALLNLNGVLLQWNSPGDSDIGTYRIYRSIFPNFQPSEGTYLAESNTTQFLDTTAILLPMMYYYIVIGYDEKGAGVRSQTAIAFVPNFPLIVIFSIVGIVGAVIVARKVALYQDRQQKSKKQIKKEKHDFITDIDYQMDLLREISGELTLLSEKLPAILNHFDFSAKKSSLVLTIYKDLKQFLGLNQLVGALQQRYEIQAKEFHDLEKKYGLRFFEKDLMGIKETWKNRYFELFKEVGAIQRKIRRNVSSKRGRPLKKAQKQLVKKRKKFALVLFQNMFREKEREFEEKFIDLSQKIEKLLEQKKIEEIEGNINELELVFVGTATWLKNANLFASKLNLPMSFGYHYQLNSLIHQHDLRQNERQKRVAQIKTQLQAAIDLIRNFIKWNSIEMEEIIQNHEREVITYVLKNVESEKFKVLSHFVQENTERIQAAISHRNSKLESYFQANKAYPIKDQIREWKNLISHINDQLNAFEKEVNASLVTFRRFLSLVSSFHDNSSHRLTRTNEDLEKTAAKLTEQKNFSRINDLVEEQLKISQKRLISFENALIQASNKPGIMLGTRSMIWLFNEWEKSKKTLQNQLDKIESLKFKFKCEIMGEDLDPFHDEIWECTKCQARACNAHVERWFLRKQTPQCFKCGSLGSFVKKEFTRGDRIIRPEVIKDEWKELFSCPICRKPLIIDSAIALDEENLEVRTHCIEHPNVRRFVLPKTLEGEWRGIVKKSLLKCGKCGRNLDKFELKSTQKGVFMQLSCSNHENLLEMKKPISKKILTYFE